MRTRRGRRAGAAGTLASVALAVMAGTAVFAGAAPTLDDQVYGIARGLMCPVCEGQTVAESDSQLAAQMRQIIRERLQAGQAREEIVAYFVSEFGESVLAAPPLRGSGLVLWLAFPVALGAGLVILRRFLRRSMAAAPPVLSPPTPAEADQIERELRSLD